MPMIEPPMKPSSAGIKSPEPKSDPKRMLEVSRQGDKILVSINFSSLQLIQTCKRKAYFRLVQGLEPQNPSPALTFGTGIHKALEVWYSSSREARTRSNAKCDDYQAFWLQNFMTGAQVPESLNHGPCPRCASVYSFLYSIKSLTSILEPDDKRGPQNGIEILNAYFDHYLTDPYKIYVDDLGPVTERSCESVILDSEKLKISYHGTIDCILQNEMTGDLLVCDHKTTWSLGRDFLNKISPNHQYTGYVMLAQESMGLEVSDFLVNGIQVAKTKKDFSRQMTHRSKTDISELKDSVFHATKEFLSSMTSGHWPMTAPDPCALFGGCSYRAICELPHEPEIIRKSVIAAEYQSLGELNVQTLRAE